MKKSFSLIELLISLIIMSLLIAAFSPLITKKMKASDITVGSFGNSSSNSSGNNNLTNVTKEYCQSLNAIYVPIGPNVPKPLCVTKYNIGDIGIEDWSGVQKCEAGKDCTVENATSSTVSSENLQATCWVATSDKNTAASGCNNKFGGYDGCKRTVCNWTGANQMCKNIGWRLPTNPELIAFTNANYSNSTLVSEGLMFCDYDNSTTAPICATLTSDCHGSYDSNCNPHYLWSSTFQTSSQTYGRYLRGYWRDFQSAHMDGAYSARCVLDTMEVPNEGKETECYDFFCDRCKDKQFDSCTMCKKGYVLHEGKCYFGTLDGCISPTYDDTYQVVKCTSCKTGYSPCNSGSCASDSAVAKSCPPNTLKIGCTCVMQYNIGDGKYTALGEDITKVKVCTAGKPCTVENGKDPNAIARNLEPACWTGTTAGSGCNANYGGYNGCTRTICNWRGAYEMCNNIGWRLPTMPELKVFANATYTNATLASNGLMLCAENLSGYPSCNFAQGRCSGAVTDSCYPHYVWSSSFNSSIISHTRSLIESWSDSLYPLGRTMTARCVRDL